jgi:hypothetical protein
VVHFRTSAALSGAGKTYAATTFTCERIPLGMKSAIIQPTIALCKQSYVDARNRFPDVTRDAAQYCDLGPAYLLTQAKLGLLTYVRPSPKKIHFAKDDLDLWMASWRKVTATESTAG